MQFQSYRTSQIASQHSEYLRKEEGRLTGTEFVYPPEEERQLAQDQHEVIVANQPAESGD